MTAPPGSVAVNENDAPPPPTALYPPPPPPPVMVMVAVQPPAGTAHAAPADEPKATLRPVPVGSAAAAGDAVAAAPGLREVDTEATEGSGEGDAVDGATDVVGAGELIDVRHDFRTTAPAAPSAAEPPT